MIRRRSALVLGLATASLIPLADTPAHACGCLSPPSVTEGDFAVNQAGEQLIFEVEPGWITAHVLIKYQGDPASFAWLVPVPEVPTLDISPTSAFGLLDQATAPNISVSTDTICPISQYACRYENTDSGGGASFGCAADSEAKFSAGFGDAGFAGADAPGASPPPVTVINTQTVGDYQTVTFQASQASAATQWLRDNGFVVNNTTSIYMESYIQQNMVFVAAKLVPGASVTAIKPLRMRYRAAYPMIPLILTAVAAQPHLTVTSFIYANTAFKPMGHPMVTLDSTRLAKDPTGRFNYPMMLARQIDEAGGDAFAIEYSGYSSPSQIGQSSCCSSGVDYCGLANDGQCECPGTTFDATDCESVSDLSDGVTLLQQLGAKYTTLTRITTRISPEEMTFDPTFEPWYQPTLFGSLYLQGSQPSLAGCESQVMDQATLANITAKEACTSMYCGTGQCVTTASGPGCACNAGTVAQRFIDLDGQPSVTCVPATPPCDLRAGGDALPDACATASCGSGQCIDRNGIAVCQCDGGAAAVATATALAPKCDAIQVQTQSPGGENFSSPLRELAVCAPPPPSCDSGQKLVQINSPIVGVDCGNATPDPSMMMGLHNGDSGCCQQTRTTPPFGFVFGSLAVFAIILRRRRA
jgi:hypothetical protein